MNQSAFIDAIRDTLGHAPDPGRITAGRVLRFATSDRRGDDAGWCYLFPDGEGGTFGCNRQGTSHTWQATRPTTAEEKAAFAAKVREARKAAAQAEEKRREECRKQAAEIWQAAAPAPEDYPYLVMKQVKPHGVKVDSEGRLIVPVRDSKGTLHGLQRITGEGDKRFLPGTSVTGCYHAIGKPESKLLIAEGYATGAALFECTGYAVAVAFNAGNLRPVALALRQKYPDMQLVVCADDDRHTEGNPGLTKATDAARGCRGLLAVPVFSDPDGKGTDFQDLAAEAGPEIVKRLIDRAAAPESVGIVTTGDDPYPWSDPVPLPDNLPPVKPLHRDMLPGPLAEWIFDIAERMQVPPDFPAAAALVALSAVIGRGCGIHPKERDDWLVVPNLWGGIVGRPSLMKSPSMSEAQKPLYRLVHEADQEHETAQNQHTATQIIAKHKKAAAETRLKEAIKKNQQQAIETITEELTQIEADTPPAHRRYVTTDGTTEKIGELLRDNPRGLQIVRDELIGWLKSLDKAGREGDRAFYLQAWNGTGSFTVDRIARGTITVPALCLSIFGAITPGALADYVYQAQKGGAGDDGLMQRFQVMVWPDTPATWQNIDQAPNAQAKHHAFHIFKKLAGTDCFPESNEVEDLPALRFTPGAQALFNEWRLEQEPLLRGGELPPVIESHLAKYKSLVPSLALIFHLVNVADGIREAGSPVDEQAALMALIWGEYLESHAWRIYGAATSPGMEAAREIVKRIQKGDIQDGVTIRDVWRHNWTRLTTADEVKAGLIVLQDYEWLTVDRTTTGGRPSEIIRLNPNIKR